MTLLSPIFISRRAKRFQAARASLEIALNDFGPMSFEAVTANTQRIESWAALNFGRPMQGPCARSLYTLDSLIGRRDTEILFHGGLIDRRTGQLRRSRPYRYATALMSALYVVLAGVGAVAFSVLVLATPLHPAIRGLLILLIFTALIGHATHGFLVLVHPLVVYRRLAASNLFGECENQ